MDAPAAAAELRPTQSQRRRGGVRGAHSIEVYFIFIICFAILSLLKLHPLAWNEVQNKMATFKLIQQLDSGSRFNTSSIAGAGICASVIESLTSWPQIVWPQKAPKEISKIVKSMVMGDFVEVDSGKDCHEVGRASLAAAIIQRAVKKESTCNPQTRAIWLVIKHELCLTEVRKIFEEHNFVIFNETNPAVREGVDVPIFLLKGDVTTWADSKIRDVAVLRFSKSVESSYEDTLFALFAFYRRVRVNGYIISDQHSLGTKVSPHTRAMEVFFTRFFPIHGMN